VAAESRTGELRFEASARLQRLLGRDLLPDDGSAIEELVKNAYDSNASEVTVTIIRPSGDHSGEIEIRDNGWGLSLAEFRRVWMRAGYSEKTAQPLPGTGRIQVGEKGIGRFAADKLGERLTVITKPKGQREAIKVLFDWKRFEQKKRLLSEIPVTYEHVADPLLPEDQSGTVLRIEKLRASWDDKTIEGLRRRLARLLNPYDPEQKFKITLIAPRRRLSGPIVPSEIRGADFEWEVTRTAHGKVRVRRRARTEADGERAWANWEAVPVAGGGPLGDEEDFGPVKARFSYFIERPKRADVGDAVPGVGVYRDGLRVEPAGSSEADWLGLLERRAKRAGHMPLVPSRLFGFVQISREDNPALQDATNRRAFIGGPALEAFRGFLQARLKELEGQVETEVAKPRWEKSRQIKSQKLLQARYKTVSIMSLSLAHELRQPLQSIQTASENIVDHLKHAGVAIPQVDAAADVIQRNVLRIDKHIQFLKELGSGKQEEEIFVVGEVVGEVLAVFKEFAAARNVSLVQTNGGAVSVRTNRSTLLAALTNLVLNACQAIEESGDQAAHEVRVGIGHEGDAIKIRVEDDGPGIPEANRPRLFRRQTTSKQGGMGIGLIVWRDALQMFGGELECEKFSNPTTFTITVPTGGASAASSAGR
jgi:hypothetical protein